MDTSQTADEAFLQRRVAQFGLFCAILFSTSVILRGIVDFRSTGFTMEILFHPFMASLCFLIVWLLCRGRPRSTSFVRTVETLGIVIGCGFLMMMAQHIPIWAQPHLIVILAFTYPLFLRSIYVPSSATRTFALGAYVGIELVVYIYISNLDFDPTPWLQFSERFAQVTQEQYARNLSVSSGLWWLITLASTTAASSVIFGLRRDVKNARQLGQYRLEKQIGTGGMGMVYRASHAMLRRPTAIKIMKPDFAGENALQRFEQEVQVLATLKHPNVVTVFDYGHTPDGVFYYAMEMIDGATLQHIVDMTGPLDVGRASQILKGVTAGLVEAHGAHLIHRDLKPLNIMAYLPHRYGGAEEAVKVLDFGLVTRADSELEQGRIVGTPKYMAPEQIAGIGVDARTDIYALGCVGYYLLTGSPPFVADDPYDICEMQIEDTPPPFSTHGVDAPFLEKIVMACLEKDPAKRPQTMRELHRMLTMVTDIAPFDAQDAFEWWEEYGFLFEPDESAGTADTTDYLAVQLQRSRK